MILHVLTKKNQFSSLYLKNINQISSLYPKKSSSQQGIFVLLKLLEDNDK